MYDALSLAAFVYGLAIVVALAAAVVIKGVVGAVSLTGHRAPTALPATPPVAAAVPAVSGNIPEHHLVVIAAAAQAMLGGHRILHIEAPHGPAQGWAAEGRLAHHAAHRPSTHH